MTVRSAFVSVCSLLLLGLDAPAQEFAPPRLSQFATDLTGTLQRNELAQLNSTLEQFNRETSTQVVMLMVGTTGIESVEEASLKVAELNKIGRKGKAP